MVDVDPIKKVYLFNIMQRVHALVDLAWPNGMPAEGLGLLADIQNEAATALGLPDDLDLMTGIETIDQI